MEITQVWHQASVMKAHRSDMIYNIIGTFNRSAVRVPSQRLLRVHGMCLIAA